MADFVTVAQTDELQPGDRAVVQLGRDFVVLFNVDGTFYAVEDMCSHEDYELSDGELNGFTLECRHHGASFDVLSLIHI